MEPAGTPVEPFEDDGVVESAEEGVVDDDVLAVANIDSVGVVAPQADQFDVVDLDVAATEGAQAPDIRVAEDNAFDLCVGAIREPDASAALIRAYWLVSMMPRPRIRTPTAPRASTAV